MSIETKTMKELEEIFEEQREKMEQKNFEMKFKEVQEARLKIMQYSRGKEKDDLYKTLYDRIWPEIKEQMEQEEKPKKTLQEALNESVDLKDMIDA